MLNLVTKLVARGSLANKKSSRRFSRVGVKTIRVWYSNVWTNEAKTLDAVASLDELRVLKFSFVQELRPRVTNEARRPLDLIE